MIHTPCYCGSVGLQEVTGPVNSSSLRELLPRLAVLKNQKIVILFFNKTKGFPGIDHAIKTLIAQASAPPRKIITVAKGFPGMDYEDIFVAFRKIGTPECSRIMEYYLAQEQWRDLKKRLSLVDQELEKFLEIDGQFSGRGSDGAEDSFFGNLDIKGKNLSGVEIISSTPKREAPTITIQMLNAKVEEIRHKNKVLTSLTTTLRQHSEEVIQGFETKLDLSKSLELSEDSRRASLALVKQRVYETLLEKGY